MSSGDQPMLCYASVASHPALAKVNVSPGEVFPRDVLDSLQGINREGRLASKYRTFPDH